MSELSDFSINTSSGSYQVLIGKGLLGQHIASEQAVWFVDETVSKLYEQLLPKVHLQQHAIESKKSLDSVALVIEQMRDFGATRQSHLIAVGGGIVQDIATLSASCYMRGIAWTYCPTTLLSMVDSCIGGKSSINVGPYKNIAGNFFPPQRVIIDPQFCETLSEEQVCEGLCEAVKICYAESDATFQSYLSLVKAASHPLTGEQLANIVRLSLQTTKKFIEVDEFDQGVRLLLNFGHTFGHAIEGASNYTISHGNAVGLGMLAARYFSTQLGLCPKVLPVADILNLHIRELLGKINTIEPALHSMRAEDAMQRFQSDKKHTKDAYNLILFDGHGRLQRVTLQKTDLVQVKIFNTFKHLIENYYEI